jgi:hypothetical protein
LVFFTVGGPMTPSLVGSVLKPGLIAGRLRR